MHLLVLLPSAENIPPEFQEFLRRHITAWSKGGHKLTLLGSQDLNWKLSREINVLKVKAPSLTLGIRKWWWNISQENESVDLVVIPLTEFVSQQFIPQSENKLFITWSLNSEKLQKLLAKYGKNANFIVAGMSVPALPSKLNKKKVEAIEYGIDLPKQVYAGKNKRTILLFISSEKDFDDAIQIINQIERREVKYNYRVIAEKGMKLNKSSLMTTEAYKKITFINKSVQDIKGSVFSDAYFSILLGSEDMQNYLVKKNASYSVPVVRLGTSGKKNVVNYEDNGYIEKPDLQEIVQTILKVNDKDYTAMVRKARFFADNYTWNTLTAESLKFIESI
jgi:glycosyltransferase involved in cell wall biosynthesis